MHCLMQQSQQQQSIPIHVPKYKSNEQTPLPRIKSIPKYQHHKNNKFQPYQKGQKIIESTPTPVFRIGKPFGERNRRIKTDHNDERCQPISHFFQKYIRKSIEKRQSKYNFIDDSLINPTKKQLSPSQDSKKQIKHIFFDANNILKRKFIRLPQERRQPLKCKLRDRGFVQDLSQRPIVQSKSLVISVDLPRCRTQTQSQKFVLKSKDIALSMSPLKMKVRKQRPIQNHRYSQQQDNGDKLTPWSFLPDNQL